MGASGFVVGESQVVRAAWPDAQRVASAAGQPGPAQVLVVGSSEEVPNEVRVYHVASAFEDGTAILTRHDGIAYTGSVGQLAPYRAALDSMAASVVQQMPPSLGRRARGALVQRWNRDWGVATLGEVCAVCLAECRAAQVSEDPPPVREAA